ncbi:MAG: hypothetical protein GEV06_26240 [Luteitalea sp.]|nr:hypothetical protein [Luteitalea sp.]
MLPFLPSVEGSTPALYRLERQGLNQSEWRVTENNRRARYYSLTRGDDAT